MKKVGFAAIPHDGIKEAIKLADYQCRADGGRGVLREVTDLIILAKFGNKKLY
jgi:3-deoxy-D-manno-octulosonate 8-phosphate phosphatase KdsC-like HAD superfamily phosphatase